MQVGTEFQARHGDDWAPNYHAMLYNLTDDAIQGEQACWGLSWWVLHGGWGPDPCMPDGS